MTTESASTHRVLVLIATIPARRKSCERLLAELTRQTRKPDGVVLVLDGYGEDASPPACTLPVVASYRTAALSGAGNRWRVAKDLPPEDILICLDDDIVTLEAPGLIKALVKAVEDSGGAAAAMGRSADGKGSPPGVRSRGMLLYAAGCGLTTRAKHLVGLQEFAAEVRANGGPDALGLLGDDDALVSAYLWKQGVTILHAATGNIFAAPTTRTTSQTAAKLTQRREPDAQKAAIGKATGWPWRGTVAAGKVVHVQRRA